MITTSQSRHLSLHWLDRPQEWLAKLESFQPHDGNEAWRWHVSHHQLLTLAKRSEREVGLSILWFSIADRDETLLLGAFLPDERLALVAPHSTSTHETLSVQTLSSVHSLLRTRLHAQSIMGTKNSLSLLNLLNGDFEKKLIERQLPWGKRLTNIAGARPQRRGSLTATRRATEADRATLNRWARLFAADTQSEAIATTAEVSEWVRRGRLLVFETDRPIGMAALSGEFIDPDFGRSCRLSLFFVDPIYRNRGLGHEMMEAIENEARLESVNALVLYSDPTNERIKKFYTELGFSPSDEWLEIESGFNVNTTG